MRPNLARIGIARDPGSSPSSHNPEQHPPFDLYGVSDYSGVAEAGG